MEGRALTDLGNAALGADVAGVQDREHVRREQIAPIPGQIAAEYGDRLEFVKSNVDENPQIAQTME
jgi:hypothetical protein